MKITHLFQLLPRKHTAYWLLRLYFLNKGKEAKQKFSFSLSLPPHPPLSLPSLFSAYLKLSEQFLAESWNVFWLWQQSYILYAFRPCCDLEAEYWWRQVTFCCTGCRQVPSKSFHKSRIARDMDGICNRGNVAGKGSGAVAVTRAACIRYFTFCVNAKRRIILTRRYFYSRFFCILWMWECYLQIGVRVVEVGPNWIDFSIC